MLRRSISRTLEALRSTDEAANLPGRLRLIEIQNQLVELLAYIEEKEGYTLLNDERKKCEAQTQRGTAAGSRPSPVPSAEATYRAPAPAVDQPGLLDSTLAALKR